MAERLSVAPLHDRVSELAELERAWGSGKPELLLALGRRRAGKSFLLRRFLHGHAGFYYQATKTTAREQLRALGEAVGQRTTGHQDQADSEWLLHFGHDTPDRSRSAAA